MEKEIMQKFNELVEFIRCAYPWAKDIDCMWADGKFKTTINVSGRELAVELTEEVNND